MKSVNRLLKLAEKFSVKLAQQPIPLPPTSQAMEAPDFFFGKGYGYSKFDELLGKLSVQGENAVGDKSLAALMANFFNKTKQSVSVTVSVQVVPGKGAKWVTQISPPAFTQTAMAELNKQFQAVTGKSWAQGQADANTAAIAAKTVEGPGTVQILDKGL